MYFASNFVHTQNLPEKVIKDWVPPDPRFFILHYLASEQETETSEARSNLHVVPVNCLASGGCVLESLMHRGMCIQFYLNLSSFCIYLTLFTWV